MEGGEKEPFDPPVPIPVEDVLDLHSFRPAETAGVVADYVQREAFVAGLRAAVENALKPVQRQVTALTLSIADVRRASAERRRRPPPGDERHAYDGDGNVLQCFGEGCHDYDPQSGRWVARRGEGRP